MSKLWFKNRTHLFFFKKKINWNIFRIRRGGGSGLAWIWSISHFFLIFSHWFNMVFNMHCLCSLCVFFSFLSNLHWEVCWQQSWEWGCYVIGGVATHITNIYLLKINSSVQLYIYFDVYRSSVQINTCKRRFTGECNSRVNMITTSI